MRSFVRLLPVLVLVLAGCVSQPSRGPSTPRSPTDARLDAVQQALDEGDVQSAEQGLSTLQTNQLNGREYTRYRLLHGELALARHDPEAAVRALPAQPGNGPFAAQILKLRGQALFQLHRPVAATAALVRRERLLPGSDQAAANRNLIWNNLLTQPLDPQHLAGLSAADPVTRGWIRLAQLAQNHADLQALEAWGQRYPDHPANARLAELMMQGPSQTSVLGQAPQAGNGPAVLLLPTSGRLQNAAQLVQSGFRAVAASVDPVDRSPVALDTDTQPATAAYQQAVGQGAGLVIGPLRKSEVQSLAQQGAPQVPILALNYLDDDAAAVPGLYQFGLAPDDEARADADNAYAQGLSRVAALVPNDPRGQRILAALTQRVEKLGGQVVTSQTYPANAQSYTDQIRQLLGIDASLAREQAVASAIGSKPKFTPRRRRDIDYLFFAASRSQARVIWPQLRYFGAWNIPTYTLSVVADKGPDHDLSGLRYCGAPWLTEQDPVWADQRSQILAASDGRPDLGRLYALGMDAARLAARLRQGPVKGDQEIAGETGVLQFNGRGVVRRRLACAQLKADQIVSLDAAPLPLPGTTLQTPAAGLPASVPASSNQKPAPSPFTPSPMLPPSGS